MTLLAHGGTGGAIAEIVGLVALVALFVGVWLKGRRDGDEPEDAPPGEEA